MASLAMASQDSTSPNFPLHRLPREILTCIFDHPSTSHTAIKLWKCGDRALHSKLSKCMTSLRLWCLPWMEISLPPVVSQLRHLRHLALRSDNDLMKDHRQWPIFFNALPGTLESIRIASLDSSKALLNSGPKEPVITFYERGTSALIDLGRLFPRLETLAVLPIFSEHNHTALMTIKPVDLPGLPSTLTSLMLKIVIHPSAMALLPPSLLHFSGDIWFVNDAKSSEEVTDYDPSNASLIPSLQSIAGIHLPLFFDYRWLPRTLTSIHPEIRHTWDLRLASRLPPLVKNLHIMAFHPEIRKSIENGDLCSLPRYLTELTLERFPLGGLISQLPRTLIKLFIVQWGYQNWLDIQKQIVQEEANWPPLLQDLDINPAPTLEYIDLLPTTLTSMTLTLRSREELDGHRLPPKLNRLTINSGLGWDLDNSIITGKLPSTLKVLDTRRRSLTDESIDSLPSSLRTWGTDALALDQLLHPTFLALNLLVFECDVWRYDWFKHLPRSITSLALPDIQAMPSRSDLEDGGFFEALPPRMVSLLLGVLKLSEDVWPVQRLSKSLPHLMELKIKRLGIMPSKFVQELPKGLIEVSIQLQTLDPEDASFLPPSANRINFSDCRIREHVLPYWPFMANSSLPYDLAVKARKRMRDHFY